jgi:hypothetical protein
MKHLPRYLLIGTLAVFGCQKPDAVVVNPDEKSSPPVEVTNLSSDETALVANSPVDTTGLTPADNAKFTAFVLLNNVKYDAGRGVVTVAFSRVYFGDHDKPFVWNGHIYGYYEFDFDPLMHRSLALNGLPMERRPYRIHLPLTALGPSADTTLGYFYVRLLPGIQANTNYTWTSPFHLSVVDSSMFSVKFPDDLQVLSPVGGSVLSRDKELELRWTGKGPVDIVVSAIAPSFAAANPIVKPLLKLHPETNQGRAVIEPRILRSLPRVRNFVFTFIIRTRDERSPAGPFSGATLIQAASLYNCYVQLE